MVKIMNVALALGGSIVSENIENLEKIIKQLQKISDVCEKVVVVVGAGKLKKYIEYCDEEVSNAEKDMVGIKATRLNASVLKSYFVDAYKSIPETFDELKIAVDTHDIVFMGGTEPGHSTDGVSAVCAEIIDADLMVNVTNVNGVLDNGGKGDKIGQMNFFELREQISSVSCDPGTYPLMDRTAIEILERSDIKLVVVDGNMPGEIIGAINGEHSGSVIVSSEK